MTINTGYYGFSSVDSNWFTSRTNILVDNTSTTSHNLGDGYWVWLWVWNWKGPTIPASAAIERIYFRVRTYAQNAISSGYYACQIGCQHIEYPTYYVYDTVYLIDDSLPFYQHRLTIDNGVVDTVECDGPVTWGSYDYADEDYWRNVANSTRSVTLTLSNQTGETNNFHFEYIEMAIDYSGTPSSGIQLGSFG